MYKLARKALFCLPPEVSHDLSLDALGAAERLGLLGLFGSHHSAPVDCMGLTFGNPIGLAAGLDKNGDYFNALGRLGFGFVEIGTVTPKPQPGNPSPRMFRLVEEEGIINRMGFNNKGVDHLVSRVKKRRFEGVLGINIGKNKLTPDDKALDDYVMCLDRVYPYADYITVNISSPNTPGLRGLQFGEALGHLLSGIKQTQKQLADKSGRYVPVAVKIAPDMSDAQIVETAQTLMSHELDAVIATNTTIDRAGVEHSPFKDEMGGLSGRPLTEKSTHVIRVLAKALSGKLPIIGVGGISSAEHAREKIVAGATLLQLYSGFIYQGPKLIGEAVKGANTAR